MAEADQLFARFGRTCAAGEVLFREGDVGDTMYVLQNGEIRITKEVKGEEKVLAVLGPGEFFGEMAILNAKPRTATATAETESRVLVLGARTFEQMVVGNTEIAVRLIQRLARRLDAANELIEVLMHRDPKARVILGLSREAQFSGRPASPDGSVLIRMEPAELAEQVGISLEETESVLDRLRRLQIVRDTTEGLEVTQVNRLQEFYEFLEMQQRYEAS
jgi:CRP/FNR family cyclic AMP-dependent transcriptional regulator